MRIATTAVAASLVLGGCSTKNHASHVTVPATTMQPIMQRQILNAIDAGEGNPRVRELRQKIAEEPQNVRARVELAEEYTKAGHEELGLEHLRLAVERFPDSDTAVIALGRALLRANRASEASMQMQSYLRRHEDAPAAVYSWAGIASDQLEKYTDGEPMHRRAVAKAPGRDQMHNNLGYNLLMQGRKAEAAESFRRALALNPSSETARNNLGLALGDQPGEAISQFRQASDLAVAHNNLAAYLYEKGDVAGARKELELAYEYRKDMPLILENLRKVSELDGKPIQMARPESRSFWKSVARGLKQTFITSEEKHSTGTADAGR